MAGNWHELESREDFLDWFKENIQQQTQQSDTDTGEYLIPNQPVPEVIYLGAS